MVDDQNSDYSWLSETNPEWARISVAYCFSLVREVEPLVALSKIGGEVDAASPMTLSDAVALTYDVTVFSDIALACQVEDWTIVIEVNGFQGSRSEVLSSLSWQTEAVTAYRNVNDVGHFSHAMNGDVWTSFDPLFPGRRDGRYPDRLLPLMRRVGLDPDLDMSERPAAHMAAMKLADAITGVHLDVNVLVGRLVGAPILPLLPRLRQSLEIHPLRQYDSELADAVDGANSAAQRRVAYSVALHLAAEAGESMRPVIVEALEIVERGDRYEIVDQSPLGVLVRGWIRTAQGLDRALSVGREPKIAAEERQLISARHRAGLALIASTAPDAQVAAYEALRLVVPWTTGQSSSHLRSEFLVNLQRDR
jgi:uncharacterized protein DUF6461